MRRTLTVRERDVLWHEARADLNIDGMGGVEEGRESLLETIGMAQDALVFFDDVGWTEHDDRLSYTLTMPNEQLRRILTRFRSAAKNLLEDEVSGPFAGSRPEDIDRHLAYLHTVSAIEEVS